ncbi:MAG: IS1595 family transposase [Terracidiphilus sp.]|jgi:transposase-like protein
MTLYSLARKFPTEESALAHLVKVRWPSGVRCVACDHDKCWPIESTGKTGKPRYLFQCAKCKLQFSATQGTLFHDSHLPLSKWFAAIALMADAKKGISACQLQRHIGMTYKTAWYVCHRIREAMREESDAKIGGPDSIVEIDETYIGGRKRRIGVKAGKQAKTVAIGFAERGGKIHLETIPNCSIKAIKPVIDARLGADTKQVIADYSPTHFAVLAEDHHKLVSHKEELKTRNFTSTFTVESAFSLFKRGIVGSYHHLSPWHLNRYMREFCFRYNRRGLQPWIFGMTLNNMICRKPLPYKELVKF